MRFEVCFHKKLFLFALVNSNSDIVLRRSDKRIDLAELLFLVDHVSDLKYLVETCRNVRNSRIYHHFLDFCVNEHAGINRFFFGKKVAVHLSVHVNLHPLVHGTLLILAQCRFLI